MSRTKPYSRTIPHPLFERLIVEDAMKEEKKSWKPERPHEYGYFPGCVDFMDVEVKFTHLNKGDADHASIAAASIKLLNYAGIDPLILDMNIFKCSGHDQLWQGQLEVFDTLKEHNMRRLKESGIKIITCSCAECYRTFAVDYDLPNTLGIKVEHITQTLQGRGLKFKAPENVTVAYHDPCRLGRMMGEYKAPRDLIQLVNGAEMVELENNKERALCCGVSSMMYCNDATKAVRRKRLDQGTDAGIDIMLGGCPKCYMHMQCMLNEERMNPEEGHHHDYEMMDLMQFLVACLEEKKLVAEIDKNFMSTYQKVATHDGESEPIQIWAKDSDSYGGVGTDKLGIWGSVVAVDFDICVADGACIDACPVDVFEWVDTPEHPASDKKAIMTREPDCIVCRACEEVCPVDAVLITDPGDIGTGTGATETTTEEVSAEAPSETVVEAPVAMASDDTALFFHKPNKWLTRAKDVLSKEELPSTGIEKAKDMFKGLRKQTLDSLPRGKDYLALVDNEKCIGCTQCVYFCNFASIDMISWDLMARTSQFESKKALILEDTCTGCTLCAFACPVEAITMEAKI